MFFVEKCDLPEHSLLSAYRDVGAYTDCYATNVAPGISLVDFIRAFYTSVPFKVERTILNWAVSKPSTDEEAGLLAEAKVDRFAAWNVEARQNDQILLADFRGQTRSWLMCERRVSSGVESTRLYFGSAIVPHGPGGSGESRIGRIYSLLMPFHKLYSQVLLSSAKSRLSAESCE